MASITLGPMHMSNNRMYEPQRTNHFEVQILNLPGARELTLSVAEFGLPNIQNNPIELARGNSKLKFAGQTEFAGAESLVVIDYIGLDTERIVTRWHNMVYNPQTDQIGFAVDYKRNALVIEYAPDGTSLRTWNVVGLWPSGVAYGDSLSMEGSEVKRITMTMVYDRAWRV